MGFADKALGTRDKQDVKGSVAQHCAPPTPSSDLSATIEDKGKPLGQTVERTL